MGDSLGHGVLSLRQDEYCRPAQLSAQSRSNGGIKAVISLVQRTDLSDLNVGLEDMNLFESYRKSKSLHAPFKSLHTMVVRFASSFHLLHPLLIDFEMLTTKETHEFSCR